MNLEYYLVYLAMVLLLGTISSALAYRLGTSNIFFLILTGMVFGSFGVLAFSQDTIITISIVALILSIFTSTNKLSFRRLLEYSKEAVRLSFIFLVLNMVAMAIVIKVIFGTSTLMSLLFASIAFGIDPMAALAFLKGSREKVSGILEVESILNTPFTIIPAFIFIDLIAGSGSGVAGISAKIIPFLQQVFFGIGIGLLIGLFVVMIMKNYFFGEVSHLTLLTSAIIAYVAAELAKGNGIFAVAVFGIVFGNTKMHHKVELKNFASLLTYTLEILVFILMGTFLIIRPEYILRGSAVFALYIIVRFVSVCFALPRIGLREKVFMSINVPKGLDVATIVLLLISKYSAYPGMGAVINLCMLFILYSIVLSTLSGLFFKKKSENAGKTSKLQGRVISKLMTERSAGA